MSITDMYGIIRRRLERATRRLKTDWQDAQRLNQLMIERKVELTRQSERNKLLEKSLKMFSKVARNSNSLTVPAYVLVGFLGSGKTTYLARLIEWCVNNGLTPGLVINEFGRVSIDGTILRQEGLTMTELSNGCICCTAEQDLVPAMIALALNPKVDLIFVEASGIADPADMLDTLTEPAMWRTVEVGGIISVVDSLRYSQLLEDIALARRQVEFADVLVLSKCDLTTPEQRASLKAQLAEIAPRARIFEAEQGAASADPGEVLSLSIELGRQKHQLRKEVLARLNSKGSVQELQPHTTTPNPDAHAEHDHTGHHHAEHDHDHDHTRGEEHGSIATLFFDMDTPLDRVKFEAFLNSLPSNVYRAKGFMLVAGDTTPHIFHQMPGFVKIEPFSPYLPVMLKAVFIGQNLDEAAITDGLNQCAIPA